MRGAGSAYLPTRHELYGTYADRVREIARRFAPTVLVASIDEMFLDFSGCERLHGSGGTASGNGSEDRAGDVAIEGAVLQLTTAIYPIVKEVFVAARTRSLPIRLLGIQLSNLGMFEQLSLFDRNDRVSAVVDSIRARCLAAPRPALDPQVAATTLRRSFASSGFPPWRERRRSCRTAAKLAALQKSVTRVHPEEVIPTEGEVESNEHGA